jgi:probable rRNA maturation factor
MKKNLEKLLKDGGLHVDVRISGDQEIQELNKKHLGKDSPTDVLSFDMGESMEDGRYCLGDVIVNYEQAARQCEEYGNSVEEEISDLVAHGVLHLLGVHHEENGSEDEK